MALFFVTAAPLARAGVQRRVRAAPRACARVPANVGQSVAAASAAIDSAAADAVRRMQVALLVPGLNVQLENSFPYSDALLYTIVASLARSGVLAGAEVSLLFKSAGTAAAFQNEHRPLPDNVSVASFFGRDTPGAGQRPRVVQAPGFNVVVNPVSARGDPVLRDIRALVETAPDASWILLNPDFSGDRSALGVRDITEQNAFLDTFRQFLMRRPKLIPIERGALLCQYPGPWEVFTLRSDGYECVGEYDALPTRDAITAAIEGAEAPRVSASATPVDKTFFAVLGALAVSTSALFWALRIM